ncbi:MAG: aminotransferase class V-fold PLP-dependent enzyme, partial [Candidatus Solibacter usitatus]|nr:aminotransferase class V-fold PLP-dependent enzyme [Candidatus Solibacter usitatus]
AHFARRDARACADHMEWFGDMDRIRASIGRLIHCLPSDIAFIVNASTGLSLLLSGIDWQPGDQVLTLEHEFPNHYYFPAGLRHRGVEFVETPWERFHEALTSRTRLVALSTVNYSTGFRAPLDQIAPLLRERGVLLYVDGTQSLGALQFDVQAIQPDMLAVHGYKWLLAPNGAGFLYVSPSLRPRLAPNVIGWRSHKHWRNPDNLHHGTPEFSPDAEKYEGGMLNFPSLYAMGASIDLMQQIGPEAIERRVLDLAGQTRALLARAGADVLSDSPIVTARFAGRDVSALAQQLQRSRVVVAARRGNLRVSPHFYNNEEDLDRLEQALAAAVGFGTRF